MSLDSQMSDQNREQLERQLMLVRKKLKSLHEERCDLHVAVDVYVNEILMESEACIKRENVLDKENYQEIYQTAENAEGFLRETNKLFRKNENVTNSV